MGNLAVCWVCRLIGGALGGSPSCALSPCGGCSVIAPKVRRRFFIFCGTKLSALRIATITACEWIDHQRIHRTTFLKPFDHCVGKLFRGKFSTNVAGLLAILQRTVIGGANVIANFFQLRHSARHGQMIQHHHRAH